MSPVQKRVFAILLAISGVAFVLFAFPNNTGAKDPMMISLFQPDEFAQYAVVTKMLTPRETLPKTVLNFVAYRHYYYGSAFYFSSALTILPSRILEGRGDSQLKLLLLRQIISVLPTLAAALILTFVQTRFRSYPKAIALFLFLLAVPAVVKNNLWWHADGLALLFTALTFFFLDRDDLRFGRNYYFAAISVGLATGTKVIGLFFCLAIPAYLLIGVLRRRIACRMALVRGGAFVGIMAATVLIANPFLVFPSQLARMLRIMVEQSSAMSQGWTLLYAKGPASWLPIIQDSYGGLGFIALALTALGIGIWRGTDRTLHVLIAAWALPFGLYVLFAIAIKPWQFFLPILLPVFSSIVVLAEVPDWVVRRHPQPALWLWGGLALAVIGYQSVLYVSRDAALVSAVLMREDTEGSLAFYRKIEGDYLSRLNTQEQLVVFRDVRMYLPDDSRWIVRSYWNAKYSTIEEIKPDIIVLWAQRIGDYTQAGARENAVDPAAFEDTYQFYVDADHGQLRGYHLLYRDGEGLLFARDALWESFFDR